MAIQPLGLVELPQYSHASTAVVANDAGGLLDAAGEKVAFMFVVPKNGSITHLGFRSGNLTTGAVLRVSLQTVGTDGNPSGTNYGGSAPGTVNVTAANTVYRVALGTPASATRGDLVAMVIEFDSTPGNLYVALNSKPETFPSTKQFTTAWATLVRAPLFFVEYSDGTVGFTGVPFAANTPSVSFHVGSSPDEYALRFKLPLPARAEGGITTYWATGQGDFQLVLYEGTTVIAQTAVIDAETIRQTSTDVITFLFQAPVDLQANTVYRLSLKPTTTTVQRVFILDVGAGNEYLWQCWDCGQEFYLSTRTDGGAWTDVTHKRPSLAILLGGFDDGAGGGGTGDGIVPATWRGITR